LDKLEGWAEAAMRFLAIDLASVNAWAMAGLMR